MSVVGPSLLGTRQPLGPTPVGPEGAPAQGTTRDLNLVMQHSGQTEWCWAAVSTSVALFYSAKSAWTQCTLVNQGLAQQACCTEGTSVACNQPFKLSSALDIVEHLASDFGGPLTFAAIAAQIDGGFPVGVCIDWTGGGGHFVTIDGYDPNGEMIDVEDPLFGHSHVPLASFPARYQGGGTWAWTYLTRP